MVNRGPVSSRGSHQLEVSIEIEAGSGWRVTNAYIGVPNADFGGTSGQSDATLRLGGGEDVKSLKFVKIYSFDTDDLGLDRQAIIAACNAGDHPPTQEHTVSPEADVRIDVGIKAYFQKRREAKLQEGGDDAGRSQTAYARAPVIIHCLAAPSHADAPPKPVSVDIRVAQKGNTCPKDAEVTADTGADDLAPETRPEDPPPVGERSPATSPSSIPAARYAPAKARG
jgi:hypothetical protein